jgi:hypothetical protein
MPKMQSELSNDQLDRIRRDRILKEELSYVSPGLLRQPLARMSKDDRAELHDAAQDALRNAAPEAAVFSATCSFGRFPVSVRGIEGVYFVTAPDFDDIGYFERLDDAVTAAWLDYGHCDLRPEGQPPPNETGESLPSDRA